MAWQFCPLADSSMSKRKPISHRRQVSERQLVDACCMARFRSSGVNLYSWSSELAYELAICVSSPENFVRL